MSTIDPQISRNIRAANSSFWKRQFLLPATTRQITFDVVLGIVAPVLCFVFDPAVFKGGTMGPPFFQQYQVFAYLVSALEITALSAWLLLGTRLNFGARLIGGVLLSGALFCVTTGLILLPFSVMGLLLLVGIFGFTPFATAIIYLRNGSRAVHSCKATSGVSLAGSILLGALLALGLPGLLSIGVHKIATRYVQDIVQGDAQHAAVATRRLKPLKYFAGAELNGLVDAYAAEPDPSRRQQLKGCFHDITGEDIEIRIRDRD